jgi:hypothetical protein
MVAASKESLPPVWDALSGAVGAIVSLITIYPLDMIKTKLQVSTRHASTAQALRHVYTTEGAKGLYSGLGAALLGVFSTNFAYFYWYTTLRSNYTLYVSPDISSLWELALGASAGALAQIFTIPVSVVVTRQQTLEPVDRGSFWTTVEDIVHDDGWRGLWRGLRPSLVLVVNPAITFAVFQRLMDAVSKDGSRPGAVQVFVISAFAKAVATIVTYPYIMAKVRMQYKPGKEERKRTGVALPKYKGAWDVLQREYRVNGLVGWYKGLQAQLSKAVLSQALLMMIKDRIVWWTLLLFKWWQQQKRHIGAAVAVR